MVVAVTASSLSALHLLRKSDSLSYTPATLTCAQPFLTLLQRCSNAHQLHQTHSLMLKAGALHSDPLLLARLICSSCSLAHDLPSLRYALRILFLAPLTDYPMFWDFAIRGFAAGFMPEECLPVFLKMLGEYNSVSADMHSFPSLLKACSRISALSQGTQLHGWLIKLGAATDTCVQNALICLYSSCQMISLARLVFEKMPSRSRVSWDCIIASYAEIDGWEDVKSLFWLMLEEFYIPTSVTLVKMITACTKSGDYNTGMHVHRYMDDNQVVLSAHLGNALMNMYARFGEMGFALELFDQMPERDVVSWTTLIGGYARAGCLEHARWLFDRMPCQTIIACNAMLSGYISNGFFKDAVFLYREMLALDMKPDEATVAIMLSASLQLGDLLMGRSLHAYIEKVGKSPTLKLVNSLLGMYSKFGRMDSADQLFKRMAVKNEISWTLMMLGYVKYEAKEVALEIFKKMPYKDDVSWNALTAALAHCDHFSEALNLFQEMQKAEVSPNGSTLVSLLSACGRVGALELGKWLHAYIERNNQEIDVQLGSSLIDMYSKCGSLELSLEVFNNMPIKDVLAWSAMIRGLAMHGRGRHALDLFSQMQQQGVRPDGITFIGILSACSHGGFVEEGVKFFSLMTQVHGISPEIEHYSCMVDLFGRNGLLLEAVDFVKKIPVTSHGEAIWGALLGACTIHHNVKVAEYVSNHLLEVDSSNSGAYVLLSNVYAKASLWGDVWKVRNKMKGNAIKKVPGCSLIEVNGTVHEFFAGDVSHPQCKKIYRMLDQVETQLEPCENLISVCI